MKEDEKIRALRSRFTVDIEYSTVTNSPVVKLSNSWKFTAGTLDEALDQCLLSILKESYKNDSDVKKDYHEGLKELHELEKDNK